jgi:Bacterial TSP3 repeat
MKKLLVLSFALFVIAVAIAGVTLLSAGKTSQASQCPGDNDCDGFNNSIENHIGTNPNRACGLNAWPPDFNDDTYVDDADTDAISDDYAATVPPAPVRYDLSPDPAGDNLITIGDIARVSNYHGQHCIDPQPQPDADHDGFSDAIEAHMGTNPQDGCGANAWPPDLNNDTYVDIGDVSLMNNYDEQSVPPAPVRYDMSPDPNFDNFIDGFDRIQLQRRFGQTCGAP